MSEFEIIALNKEKHKRISYKKINYHQYNEIDELREEYKIYILNISTNKLYSLHLYEKHIYNKVVANMYVKNIVSIGSINLIPKKKMFVKIIKKNGFNDDLYDDLFNCDEYNDSYSNILMYLDNEYGINIPVIHYISFIDENKGFGSIYVDEDLFYNTRNIYFSFCISVLCSKNKKLISIFGNSDISLEILSFL
jgi:hypothetical protein